MLRGRRRRPAACRSRARTDPPAASTGRRDARQKFGPAPHADTGLMTDVESDRMNEILAAVDKDPRVYREHLERVQAGGS